MSILISILMSLFLIDSEVGSGPEFSAADSVESNFKIRNRSLFTESDQLYFSIDRLSYRSYNRLTGYDGTRPLILLDGLPVEADFFGNLNPQYIPLPDEQIEHIENKEGFGFTDGRPYQAGLLNIKSAELKPGYSVYGSTQISNEAGEPGPWVYDPERVTPNVERFGPGTDLMVNYGGENFYVKTLYRYHRHLNTDLAIQRRMRAVVSVPGGEHEPSIGVNQLGMVETGSTSERFSFRARALYGESDEFLYFRPLGREVPVRKSRSGVTLSGAAELSEEWTLNTMITAGGKEYNYRVNRFDYDLDLQQNSLELLASINRNSESGYMSSGFSRETSRHDAPGLIQYRMQEWALFWNWRRHLSDRISIKAGGRSAFDDEVFVSVSGGFDLRVMDGWELSGEAALIEMNPKRSGNYNHLALQGYTIFEQLNIEANLPEQIEKEQMLTFSVNQHISFSDNITFETETAVTSHRAFHIPFQEVEYDELMHTMPGTYQYFTGQTGSRLDLSGAIRFDSGNRFETRLFAGYNRTLNGTDSYRTYWEMIPRWQVRYSADFSPYPDMDLRVSAWYRSSSYWKEFEALDGEQFWTANPRYPPTFGTFTSTVPSHLQINAKVAKWFWEQRFRAVILMKNITNRHFYSHPIGVREGFTFVLRAEFRF